MKKSNKIPFLLIISFSFCLSVFSQSILKNQNSIENNQAGIMVSFKPDTTKALHAKYGVSYISIDQAKKNLDEDITSWDSQVLMEKGRKRWNNQFCRATLQ